MEFLTILLSGVLGLVTPAGLFLDRTAENAIRSQLKQADRLEVRVDNAPSYQILQGKVERVRIAGRGLRLKHQDLRISTLEIETDPVDFDVRSLGKKQPKLKRSFQAGVHLILEQQDINSALQSPELVASLRQLDILEISNLDDDAEIRYNFINPKVELLANNRLRFQVELTADNDDLPLAITVESGLGVVAGRQIQLLQPVVYVDQEVVTQQLVSEIAANLSQKLDLSSLEVYGLKARILQFKVDAQQLEIVAFLQLEPSSRFLQNHRSPAS